MKLSANEPAGHVGRQEGRAGDERDAFDLEARLHQDAFVLGGGGEVPRRAVGAIDAAIFEDGVQGDDHGGDISMPAKLSDEPAAGL